MTIIDRKRWTKIILCTLCDGRGTRDRHVGHGDWLNEKCGWCQGSGRMLERGETTVEAYQEPTK